MLKTSCFSYCGNEICGQVVIVCSSDSDIHKLPYESGGSGGIGAGDKYLSVNLRALILASAHQNSIGVRIYQHLFFRAYAGGIELQGDFSLELHQGIEPEFFG